LSVEHSAKYAPPALFGSALNWAQTVDVGTVGLLRFALAMVASQVGDLVRPSASVTSTPGGRLVSIGNVALCYMMSRGDLRFLERATLKACGMASRKAFAKPSAKASVKPCRKQEQEQ